MDINFLKVDSARAKAGDWVDNIPSMGDLRLKVRGFASPDYRAAVSTATSKVPREHRVGGDIDAAPNPEVMDKLLGRCMAEVILMDWDGLTRGGEALHYSIEDAIVFLTSPDYRPFREAVVYAAASVEKVQAGRAEGSTGN